MVSSTLDPQLPQAQSVTPIYPYHSGSHPCKLQPLNLLCLPGQGLVPIISSFQTPPSLVWNSELVQPQCQVVHKGLSGRFLNSASPVFLLPSLCFRKNNKQTIATAAELLSAVFVSV